MDGGWGEPHPRSGYMLVFGPRTDDEVEIVWQIVRASYDFATGALAGLSTGVDDG